MRDENKNGQNSRQQFQKLNLFQAEDHQPFTWRGNGPAALLVHGFPGTPAEMRPLAESLHAQGWTTQGVLLPGFGPDFPSLMERHPQEWVERNGCRRTQAGHGA
jgi:esterase/lipase